jgi:tetratricopeptide (TPR) repeat protein
VPQGLDGVSLLPLLGGAPPADPDRAVYAESLYAWRHFGWAPQRALMTRDLTLLHSTTPELYARADVTQATDLAPSDPAALEGMEGRLAALLAGMKPVAPDAGAGHVAVDAERIAALEALGYLTGVSTKGRDAAGAPVAGLPDPGKRLPVLREVEAAEQAYRRGDLATARTTAEAAVAADPGLVETQMLLASIRWRQGAPEEALRIVTAVDAQLPTAETRHLLGLLQLQLGHPEEAARLLGDAVARDPYLAAAAEVHLQTLLVLEDLPGLLAAADRARAALPDSAVVMGMAGVAKALAGDFAAAGPLLVEAVRREPGQPFVHHALGLVAEDAGEADQAEAAFREEIRRFPPATASRRALAALQARRSAGPLAQPR